jgi:fatty acid amide hydrolase
MGIGTDIGGSLRVPAAFCGIASLKPTAGRTPDPGRFSIPYGQQAIQSQVGILARHVEDVALGMEVINGGSDPAVEPPMPLHDYRGVDIGRLRVAVYTDDGTLAVAPAIKRGVMEAAEAMHKRGATVVEWTPPDAADAMAMVYAAFTADGGAWMRRLLGKDRPVPQIGKLLGVLRLPYGGLSMLLKLMESLGQKGTVAGMRRSGHRDTHHYWQLVEAIEDNRARFAAALDSHPGGPIDAIISPVCALPAFAHGASTDLVTAGAYACLYNLLGYPAGVVPVTRVAENEQVGRGKSRDVVEKRALGVETGSAGLPVGVQVVARPWREHVALAVMGAIEESARQRPDFPLTPVGGWSVVSSQ